MPSSAQDHRRSLRSLIRHPYIFAGDFLDRWYEEFPWRQRMPLGKRGEQIAARYLRRCGYLILARNYRAAGAEIDLVAVEGQTLVFVEVKARNGVHFGAPQEAVDEQQAGPDPARRRRVCRSVIASETSRCASTWSRSSVPGETGSWS